MPRKKATESIKDVIIGAPARRQNSFVFSGSLVVAGIIVVTAAVFIGKSDTGPINVSATIQESNKTAESEGREQMQVTSPIFQNLPNGGLVVNEAEIVNTQTPPPTEVLATTSASTTATTTEEVITENDITETTREITEEPTE